MAPPSPTNLQIATGVSVGERLRRSELRYRLLFETTQDGILLLNGTTAQIEDVNPYLIKMLGYTYEELLDKKLWEIGAFNDVTECKRLFAELLEKGTVRYEELPLRTATGKEIAAEFISNTYDYEGIQIIQCNIRDISERKKSEALLKTAEEIFRGLVEQSISGILIIQNDKLVYVNKRAADILNQHNIVGMIGSDFISWVAANDRPIVSGIMLELLTAKSHSVTFEFDAHTAGGETISIGANASAANHNGFPVIVGMIQDISEKKRAEEAIRHYILELKSAFMSTVRVATIISEMRDPYTAGHERRVAEIAVAIGIEMGFDTDRLAGLRVAGHLHDVGKISIPAEILAKPGKLSDIEFQLIKSHAQASYNVLKEVEFP
jgi:PAS domain S-box-containing protein